MESSGVLCRAAETKSIEIDEHDEIYSAAYLVDETHILSSGKGRKIRRWRVEDGEEVGAPMDVRSVVLGIAVSRDGKWIISGAKNGQATVWNAKSHAKEETFQHGDAVWAVDISPDGTWIASGSSDKTVCVWALSTGEKLHSWIHDDWAVAVKFSSDDGSYIATATWERNSVRIYNVETGQLLVDAPVQVNSAVNQSLVWATKNKLFALSRDGNIHCLDLSSTAAPVTKWAIHSNNRVRCIAFSGDGSLIAASANSTVSFWDPTTHKQVGTILSNNHFIASMAISSGYNMVMGGNKKITLRNFMDVLPLSYGYEMLYEKMKTIETEKAALEDTVQAYYEKTARLEQQLCDSKTYAVNLEKTIQELRNQLATSQQRAKEKESDLTHIVQAHEKKHRCEAMYACGKIYDAVALLLEIVDTPCEGVKASKLIGEWLIETTHRYITRLERIGMEASHAERYDDALKAYSTALSLVPSTPNSVLTKWAKTALTYGSAHEALSAATQFRLPRFHVYRTVCDVLEESGRVIEAVWCFRRTRDELTKDATTHQEREQWELDFLRRSVEGLERLGNSSMESKKYGVALECYANALSLSLNPTNAHDFVVRCCQARAGLLTEALVDINKVIELDPSSYENYKRKHVILHCMARHREAVKAFETMLSKLEESPEPHVRELRHEYVNPAPTIRKIVQSTISYLPRVLIDTTTGRLHDKLQQAAAFEKQPIFYELRSSMITQLDYVRIQREVELFYRYVMLSHKWEDGEPLFQTVQHISIYELGHSSPNAKLKTFCKLMRALGFCWAWADTCCIDKRDNVVLQESLVAMFMWYRGSSLTLIYLRGIWSQLQKPGDLRGSIWNTRAWTYQEYLAAKTVQFYTEDWRPYLALTMRNHKESSLVISEMQQGTGTASQDSAVLQPGLERVREKLFVASKRQTTLTEDTAYSLFGIFNAAIPVIYGEGNRAVGRLLEHVLTGSGDVSILAWTGRAGSYNTCLPVDLSAYNQVIPPHVPVIAEIAEMEGMVEVLRSSLPDLSLATTLYNRLNDLAPPFMSASRLRLAGIFFPISEFIERSECSKSKLQAQAGPTYVYQVRTIVLGEVEIKTTDDLGQMDDMMLVHPWIGPLLDQDFSHRPAGMTGGPGAGGGGADAITRALRLIARLRQPFGALLLAPLSRVQYRRVATDSLIMVQVREETLLAELMDSTRIVDVQ